MPGDKQPYGPNTRSRLNDFFDDTTNGFIDRVINDDLAITVDNSKITIDDLKLALLKTCSTFQTYTAVNPRVVSQLQPEDFKQITLLNKAMDLPLDKYTSSFFNVYKCLDMPNVHFLNGELKHFKHSNKPNDFKYIPPRLIIKLTEDVPPNSHVRINTGLMISTPTYCIPRTQNNGKVIKHPDKKVTKQAPFVLIPFFFLSEHQLTDIIPSVISRDPEDTGLFCVSFFTKSGLISKTTPDGKQPMLQIALRGFSVHMSTSCIEFLNPIERRSTQIIKNKDMQTGRYTINPKVIINAYSVIRQDDNYIFTTQNNLDELKQERFLINVSQRVLLSNRRREWINSEHISLPGFLSEKDLIKPKLYYSCNEVKNLESNTHGITFIKNRITPYCEFIDLTRNKYPFYKDSKIINGYFIDIKKYKTIRDCIRKILFNNEMLKLNARSIKTMLLQGILNSDVEVKLALLLADYNRVVPNVCDIKEAINRSDEEMYNCKTVDKLSYTTTIYNNMLEMSNLLNIKNVSSDSIQNDSHLEAIKFDDNLDEKSIPISTESIKPLSDLHLHEQKEEISLSNSCLYEEKEEISSSQREEQGGNTKIEENNCDKNINIENKNENENDDKLNIQETITSTVENDIKNESNEKNIIKETDATNCTHKRTASETDLNDVKNSKCLKIE